MSGPTLSSGDPGEPDDRDRAAERLAILTAAVRRLAHAYYENFVLSVYAGLSDPRRRNAYAQLVAARSSVLEHDIVYRGHPAEVQVLSSISDAWRARGEDNILREADVERSLRSVLSNPGSFPFRYWLDEQLRDRRGFPDRGPEHWLGRVGRARMLLDAVVEHGVYVEFAVTSRTPEELRTRVGVRALAVEHHTRALQNDEQRVAKAYLDYGIANLELELAGSTERAQARQRIERAGSVLRVARRQADETAAALHADETRFYRALGPSRRPPTSGRSGQSGRHR